MNHTCPDSHCLCESGEVHYVGIGRKGEERGWGVWPHFESSHLLLGYYLPQMLFSFNQMFWVASSSGRVPALGAGCWGFESLVALSFFLQLFWSKLSSLIAHFGQNYIEIDWYCIVNTTPQRSIQLAPNHQKWMQDEEVEYLITMGEKWSSYIFKDPCSID